MRSVYFRMDFNEFKNNIKKMESDLKEKSIDPADVKIEYIKSAQAL